MSKIFKFYGGEDRSIALRLMVKRDGERTSFTIPLGSIVTVRLDASGQDEDGNDITEITKSSSDGGVQIVNYDRGELALDLTDEDTTLMRSGDIVIEVQSGSVTRKARIPQGVKKLQL